MGRDKRRASLEITDLRRFLCLHGMQEVMGSSPISSIATRIAVYCSFWDGSPRKFVTTGATDDECTSEVIVQPNAEASPIRKAERQEKAHLARSWIPGFIIFRILAVA